MEIVGKIIQVLPAQEGVGKNGNPWKVQGYVLETQEQYPRKVQFEIFGEDRIKNNPCAIDDVVTVSFDIESREFNGRWYTSIRAWRVQQGVVTADAATNAATNTNTVPNTNTVTNTNTAAPAAMGNIETFDDAAGDDSGELPF